MYAQIMKPCHATTIAEVVPVSLIGISLTLKTNVAIGFVNVKPVLQQAHHILHKIPHIEEKKDHLHLLAGVDELMSELHTTHLAPSALHEDDAEKIDAMKTAKRNESVVDDYHDGKDTSF